MNVFQYGPSKRTWIIHIVLRLMDEVEVRNERIGLNKNIDMTKFCCLVVCLCFSGAVDWMSYFNLDT